MGNNNLDSLIKKYSLKKSKSEKEYSKLISKLPTFSSCLDQVDIKARMDCLQEFCADLKLLDDPKIM